MWSCGTTARPCIADGPGRRMKRVSWYAPRSPPRKRMGSTACARSHLRLRNRAKLLLSEPYPETVSSPEQSNAYKPRTALSLVSCLVAVRLESQPGNAMTKVAKIRSLELLSCDAGWRNYHFVKLSTKMALSAGASLTKVSDLLGSPPPYSAWPRGWLDRTRLHTSASTQSYIRLRVRRLAALLRRRSARSRTRFSMPKPNCWRYLATNCSEAKSAIASAFTGRTAPHGG